MTGSGVDQVCRQVAFAQFAVEQIENQIVETMGQFGIEADALVAHEGVGTVDFVPAETCAEFVEPGENFETAFERYVGILATPYHEEFAFDIGSTLEGIVTHAFAEAAFVNVGRVEACGGDDFGIHGCAEGEMAADTDAHSSDTTSAVGAQFEVLDDGASIVIVPDEWFCGLQFVTAV